MMLVVLGCSWGWPGYCGSSSSPSCRRISKSIGGARGRRSSWAWRQRIADQEPRNADEGAEEGRAAIMTSIMWWISRVLLLAVGMTTTPVLGQDLIGPSGEGQSRNSAPSESVESGKTEQPPWHYGGFVDLGYSLNFNFPENHLFRNRATTPRVNELDINMAGAYVRKDPSEQSRWGTEWLVQGGMDAKDYGFGANLPKVQSSDALRHFGRANVFYLAPVGNGLTVQAGLFNSFIGYESLMLRTMPATRAPGSPITPPI